MIEASDLITDLFITSVTMLESDYDSVFVIAMKLWAMVVEIGTSTDLLQSCVYGERRVDQYLYQFWQSGM